MTVRGRAWALPWLVGLPISIALHLAVAVTAMALLRIEPSASSLVVDLSAMSPQPDERVPQTANEPRPEAPAPSATVHAPRDARRSEPSAASLNRTGGLPKRVARAAAPPAQADPPHSAATQPATALSNPPPPVPPQPVPSRVAPSPPSDAERPTPRVAASPEAPPPPTTVTAESAAASPGEGASPAATSAAVRDRGAIGQRPGSAGASGGSPGGGTGGGPATRGSGGSGGGDQVAAIAPGGGDGLGADYGPYRSRLRQRIQETLRYPPAARRRGVSGTVQLEIAVQPDGSIGAVTVVASSTHELLDRAAVDAVRSLPRVPFPADVRPTTLTVRLPVVFELQDR